MSAASSTEEEASLRAAQVAARAALPPVPREQSDSIKIARVLCIFFMMSTHGWPGSNRILAAEVAPALHLFYLVVVDVLGVISGMLFVISFERRGPRSVLGSKFKTLVVPMIVWSLPLIAIGIAKSRITGEPSPLDGSTLDLVNLLIPITTGPANGPLHFLRDIFIMALYGSVILLIFRRSTLFGILAALAVFLVEQIPGGFLLFRNQIATMFIFGLLLARLGHAGWRPNWPLVLVLMAIYLSARWFDLLQTSPREHLAFRISEHVPRVAMAFFIWRVSYEIARRPNWLRTLCQHLEPHIFTIFCLHAVIASFVGGAALVFGWHETAPYYPLIFVTQLVAFVILGVIASKILTPFPWLRGKAHGERKRAPSVVPPGPPAEPSAPAMQP